MPWFEVTRKCQNVEVVRVEAGNKQEAMEKAEDDDILYTMSEHFGEWEVNYSDIRVVDEPKDKDRIPLTKRAEPGA